MLMPFLLPKQPLQHTIVLAEDQLPALARAVATVAYPHMVLSLEGGLGAGKTTFVRHLGEALGIPVRVTSPTFVYYNQYPVSTTATGVQQLVHADCYRLAEATEAVADPSTTDNWLVSELLTVQQQAPTVLVVEWGSVVAAQLQPCITHHLQITTVQQDDDDDALAVRQYQWFGSNPLTLESTPSE